MAGRGLRTRAPVSYNEKQNPEGMVPAWLKTIQPNVQDPPPEPKRRKKVAKAAPEAQHGASPTTNKENDVDDPTTVDNVSPAGKGRDTKKPKMVKRKVASRGRNGGFVVQQYGTRGHVVPMWNFATWLLPFFVLHWAGRYPALSCPQQIA
jgi:hypothetical protein